MILCDARAAYFSAYFKTVGYRKAHGILLKPFVELGNSVGEATNLAIVRYHIGVSLWRFAD